MSSLVHKLVLTYSVLIFACIAATIFYGVVGTVKTAYGASYLSYVSDTLSESHPASSTDQTIRFTLTQALPASGQIVIDLSGGGFVVPAALNYTDVDIKFSAAPGGPYTERPVSSISSPGTDGVVVTSGASGNMTITLNSSVGIPAGNEVKILIGTNATYQTTGDQKVTLGSATGSYPVVITTYDASSAELDFGQTRIFIIEHVTAGPVDTTDDTPPVIVSAEPTGVLQYGTENVELVLLTNELSTCKYATTSGVLYDNMPVTFTATSGTLAFTHTSVVTSLISSSTYSYFIRCTDFRDNKNTSDYLLEFTIGIVPGSATTTSTSTGTGTGSGPNASSTGTGTGTGTGSSGSGSGPGTVGSSGGGGGSGGNEGGEFLYQADVRINGYAYPNSVVTVLQDGENVGTLTAGGDAQFDELIEGLERGAYTFGLYATDAQSNRSATYNTTIYLRSNTVNQLSNIMLPPTVIPETKSVDPGAPLNLSGYTAPNASIRVALRPRLGIVSATDMVATTTAAANGIWTMVVDTTGLTIGTYELIAEAGMPDGTIESDKSAPMVIGIGQDVGDVEGDGLRADLNRDGFVNLIDFSILLFNWNTSDAIADINEDGIVDLTDFSIMIFYWTG